MIRLTQTVQKGGCAAKLPAGTLGQLLKTLPLERAPELTLGPETLDDACLWDMGDRYLIQTLDFFTPIVDDPYDFGAIAAANALSDVYAMGGEPKIALSILAFPTKTLPLEILAPLMAGALSKIHEAGASLAGGHTIDDDTLKFGFSVTGWVEKGKEWTNAGAKVGDQLILTKPLGTGTITTALKQEKAQADTLKNAIESMKQLNSLPKDLNREGIHAATDITGFGLAGHALQMAEASQVRFEIESDVIPFLPGSMELLEQGFLNRAHRTNREYVEGRIDPANSLVVRNLTFDPQTSGGLLLSVAAKDASTVLKSLKSRFSEAAVIGQVVSKEPNQKALAFV